MPTSIKNILIGVFVIAAVGIIAFMLLFLHPSVGNNAKTLRAYFSDIDKVNLGTRVTFAGRPVGEVAAIHELPSIRTSRVSKHGEIYAYELILKVDSSVDVFNTDEVTLRTSGLLGERNIEITPRPLKPDEKLINVDEEVLYAVPSASVEDTMKKIGNLSQKLEIVLDDIHGVMNNIKREEVVVKVGKSLQNILDITDALNQPDKWKQSLDNFHTMSERVNLLAERAQRSWTTIDHTLNNVYQLSQRAHHSWGTLDQTLKGFETTATNAIAFTDKVNQMVDFMRQGKGNLGQLVMGDDLYLRIKSILHKGEVVMDDVHTYGLLFQQDKRWQRLQARRLRLLEKLSSPNEFACYFNQEMDQISSSLSRVSMALNESECYPQSLIYNPNFTRRFAELLRRVENMEDSLKMYNEQVVDQE